MENIVIDIPIKNQTLPAENNKALSGFIFESEEDRLLRDALRPDMEKLQLFTRMIRRNIMLKSMTKQP